jgi:outer membrane protein TolC
MSNATAALMSLRPLRFLAASLALALAGCATPVLKESVDMPGRFAATPGPAQEPEAAWWDSYGDPVLSGLIRRAA